MARTIAEIQKQILDGVAADTTLSTLLTSKSKRAIYVLWSYIISVCIAIFEQIIDVFKKDVETVVNAGAPSTPSWIQAKLFLFQYSTDVPQVVQLINFAPVYPVVDPTLRIITRASVTTNLSNSVIIKVAKGDPPEALDGLQLAAVQSFINIVGTAGVDYVVRSESADKLYIQATIFYSGLFSSVIQANVITAIKNYLAALPFNGSMKISDIESAILSVDGVNDVILENVRARADATLFVDGTDLVLNNATIARLWPTQAGYIVEETEAGQTFSDSLTFIPE